MPAQLARRDAVALLGAALAGVCGPRAVAAQGARKPLRIATIPTDVGTAPFYGRAFGAFERAGIDADIQVISSGPAIAAAIAAHSVDVGFSNCLSLEVAHVHGLPLTIVAGAGLDATDNETAGLLTVLAGAPYRNARDLNGKTVAIGALGSVNDLALRNWMDGNGGEARSVNLLEMPLPEMPAALSAGRIAAASMTAVSFAAAPAGQYRLLASTYASIAPRFVASAWFASQDWVRANQPVAAGFVSIVRAMSAWANANPRAAIELAAKTTRFVRADLERTRPPTFATVVTPALVQPTIDVAVRYQFLPARFSAADLIDPIAQTPPAALPPAAS